MKLHHLKVCPLFNALLLTTSLAFAETPKGVVERDREVGSGFAVEGKSIRKFEFDTVSIIIKDFKMTCAEDRMHETAYQTVNGAVSYTEIFEEWPYIIELEAAEGLYQVTRPERPTSLDESKHVLLQPGPCLPLGRGLSTLKEWKQIGEKEYEAMGENDVTFVITFFDVENGLPSKVRRILKTNMEVEWTFSNWTKNKDQLWFPQEVRELSKLPPEMSKFQSTYQFKSLQAESRLKPFAFTENWRIVDASANPVVEITRTNLESRFGKRGSYTLKEVLTVTGTIRKELDGTISH